MADQDNGSFAAFLAGLVFGGIAGAVAALLLAPQSGEETREQIRQRGIELRDRTDEEIAHIRKQAEATLADVRTQAEELTKKAQDAIEDARGKVSTAVEQGVEAAKKKRNDLTGDTSAST